MPLINLRETPIIKSLFLFGPNRSGKSHLAASARELKELNPLLIDADEGGRVTWLKFKMIEDNVAIWEIPITGKLGELSKILEEVKVNHRKLVVFDSITYFMNSVQRERFPDVIHIPIHEWDYLFRQVSVFIGKLKAYCSHIIFTGFAETTENEAGKVSRVEPMIMGRKFPAYLLSNFNVIGFLHTLVKSNLNKNYYETTFTTLSDGIYCVGDRFDSLGDIKNPTLKGIFDKMDLCIKGEVK